MSKRICVIFINAIIVLAQLGVATDVAAASFTRQVFWSSLYCIGNYCGNVTKYRATANVGCNESWLNYQVRIKGYLQTNQSGPLVLAGTGAQLTVTKPTPCSGSWGQQHNVIVNTFEYQGCHCYFTQTASVTQFNLNQGQQIEYTISSACKLLTQIGGGGPVL